MNKIKSLEELKKIRERVIENIDLRTTSDNKDRTVIVVGMATCGIAAGAREIMSTLIDEIHKHDLKNISVVATGCLGYCFAEPLVEIRPPHKAPSTTYSNVTKDLAKEIIDKHLKQGILIENSIFNKGGN